MSSHAIPNELADLVVRLVSPQPGERICDPACGSGALLSAAARFQPEVELFGQEMDTEALSQCQQNLVSAGITAQLHLGDVLTHPQFVGADRVEQFDLLVSAPPFGRRVVLDSPDPWHRFHRADPSKTESEWAYATHMLEASTRGEGRIAVVLPLGTLFRRGAGERMRKPLIQENCIDGVIALPPALLDSTTIPLCILLLRRSKPDETIFFIDASREYSRGRRQNRLRNPQIERIVEAWRTRASQCSFAYLATQQEVTSNDWDLSISRYINPVEEFVFDPNLVRRQLEMVEDDLFKARTMLDDALAALPDSSTNATLIPGTPHV